MLATRLIVVASSAGGIRALTYLLAELDPGIDAAVAVVQHLDPRHRSLLPDILAKGSGLRVRQASEGCRVLTGEAYIAPPDRHLLINPDRTLSLSQAELVHFLRPSADLLFESAAAVFKENCIGVVLTGTGSDGTMGVTAIKASGGLVVSQDAKSAEFSGMPSSAIQSGNVDYVLSLEEIPDVLSKLTRD